jgi:hypothetical protein
MWEPIVAEHGWDWEVVCTGKLTYCFAAEVAPRKRKRKKNESTVTLKSPQPAEQNQALKKDKRLAMPLFYQLALVILTTGGYLILPSLGLGSLH